VAALSLIFGGSIILYKLKDIKLSRCNELFIQNGVYLCNLHLNLGNLGKLGLIFIVSDTPNTLYLASPSKNRLKNRLKNRQKNRPENMPLNS
jgi:hypothetical protein